MSRGFHRVKCARCPTITATVVLAPLVFCSTCLAKQRTETEKAKRAQALAEAPDFSVTPYAGYYRRRPSA